MSIYFLNACFSYFAVKSTHLPQVLDNFAQTCLCTSATFRTSASLQAGCQKVFRLYSQLYFSANEISLPLVHRTSSALLRGLSSFQLGGTRWSLSRRCRLLRPSRFRLQCHCDLHGCPICFHYCPANLFIYQARESRLVTAGFLTAHFLQQKKLLNAFLWWEVGFLCIACIENFVLYTSKLLYTFQDLQKINEELPETILRQGWTL